LLEDDKIARVEVVAIHSRAYVMFRAQNGIRKKQRERKNGMMFKM